MFNLKYQTFGRGKHSKWPHKVFAIDVKKPLKLEAL